MTGEERFRLVALVMSRIMLISCVIGLIALGAYGLVVGLREIGR